MKKTFSTIKKTFALLTICFVSLALSSFNSQEHKLLGDRGMSRVKIPRNINFPFDLIRWEKVPSYENYSSNWLAAKMLAVGYNTNNDGDYSLLSTCQDNCYDPFTFRQKDGNKANFIEALSPDYKMSIPASLGNNPAYFSFGDLVALYGDFRRTVFCTDGTCNLSSQNNVDIAFEGRLVNVSCPPPIKTDEYLQRIAFGLWPPYGTFGNILKPTVGETDYDKAAWWGDEMMRLANVNETHFSDVAVAWYVGMHRLALLYVNKARTDPKFWVNAMHYEASALHCLTDLFCLGHVVTSRDESSFGTMKSDGLLDNISYRWMENVIKMGGGNRDAARGKITLAANSPIIADANNKAYDFMPSYFTKNFSTYATWAKDEHTYHDKYNNGGAIVNNLNGNRFQIFGDGKLHLLQDGKSRGIIEDAVTASVQSLFTAYDDLDKNGGKINPIAKAGSGYFEALTYIPVFIETLIDDPDFKRWTTYADYVETMTGKRNPLPHNCKIQLLDGENDLLISGQNGRSGCSFFPQIGNQVWTYENLDESTYTDGTPIPQVQDPAEWSQLTTGAWCYITTPDDPDGENYSAVYGKLYNWYAVAGIWNEESKTNPAKRKQLAPDGWHVPTDDEWSVLENYLGSNSASNALKEAGREYWAGNNAGTNSTGFTALPGGVRNPDGKFAQDRNSGFWWSSSENGTKYAWNRWLSTLNDWVGRVQNVDKRVGISVRCIKNQ